MNAALNLRVPKAMELVSYLVSSLLYLIRSANSQSSSYPIVLTRLGGPRSRPNLRLELWEVY